MALIGWNSGLIKAQINRGVSVLWLAKLFEITPSDWVTDW